MVNINKSLIHISKKFNTQNKEEALKNIKDLLKKYPNNKDVNNLFYQICIKLNLKKDAINSLNKLIILEPSNENYLQQLYKLHIRNNNYRIALKIINKLLSLKKNNFEALRDKSYILYIQNDIINSHKYAEIALRINKDDYFLNNIHGLILFNKNKYVDAINFFKKATNNKKDYIDGYNNLGNCYYELEDFKNSFFYFKKAYRINKNNETSLINIANILSLKNKNKSSINMLSKILERNPNNTKALYNLCLCYFRIHDDYNSKKFFNKLIKIDPNNEDLKYAYSTYNLGIGEFDNAWKYFESRLKLKKQYKSFNNNELIENKISSIESIRNNDKILILREQGIGEEILFSSIYKNIISRFDNIFIESDKRLVKLFENSFKKNIFFADGFFSNNPDKIENFDHVIYAGSFLKLFIKNKKYLRKNSYLKPDNEKFIYFEKKLSNFDKKLKIGISWKSILNIYGNLKSLTINDFTHIFKKNRIIINLQYGNINDEINYLNKHRYKLINFDNINIFNDFDSTAAILKNLDLFITVSNSTAHIAAALGIPTIVICPSISTTYYYWNIKNQNSYWYENVRVIPVKDTKLKTFKLIDEIILDFEKNK